MTTIQYAPGETGEPRNGLVAAIMVDGADQAAALYGRAFGAKEVARVPVDDKGRTMHIHLEINGSSLMMSDPYPEYGRPAQQPAGIVLTLCVENVDYWWQRTTATEGMEIIMPLEKMFWGDRYGVIRDPFGFEWAFVGT